MLKETDSFLSSKNKLIESKTNAVKKIQLAWKRHALGRALCNQHLKATIIQSHVRCWLSRKSFLNMKRAIATIQRRYKKMQHARALQYNSVVKSAIVIQSHVRRWFIQREALRQKYLIVVIQLAWKRHALGKALCNQHLKATIIQSHIRCWLSRKSFLNMKRAIATIQRIYKKMQHARALQYKSAIVIQSHVRRWFIQREALRQKYLIVVIQSHCRAWLMRRSLLLQREAATKIQTAQRCHLCWKNFRCIQYAAIEVQCLVRGQIARRKLLGASRFPTSISTSFYMHYELKIIADSVLKLQRWWKDILFLRSKNKSVIIIQSHIRTFIARREATRKRHHIVVLQSYWRGYLVRKETRGQLHDLRLRVKKSATNVDDSMRLINRHLVALSELLSMKSVSGILHTCATLDFATKHSQKCCEKLVEADAVDTLLTLIRSVSQSIPDQQVLRHALSTLRNLARYPHLLEVVTNSNRSIETIFWVLLRNKEEGYFVASELLKKICSNQNGVKSVRSFPALMKRLHSLVEDLTRKISYEKRKGRVPDTKDITERRLREAAELLKLTTG